MGTLLTYIFRYAGFTTVTLGVIIAVLVTAQVTREKWNLIAKQEQYLRSLADTERAINQFRDKSAIEFKRRVPNQDASFDLIKKQLANLSRSAKVF